jgi:hypothetical protein
MVGRERGVDVPDVSQLEWVVIRTPGSSRRSGHALKIAVRIVDLRRRPVLRDSRSLRSRDLQKLTLSIVRIGPGLRRGVGLGENSVVPVVGGTPQKIGRGSIDLADFGEIYFV